MSGYDAPMASHLGTVLRIRSFRSLVFATTLSQLGDRLTHMLLITVIALARPGKLFGYSEGALAFALPTLLLAPFVGVLVDRWDKRKVLAFTHFVQSGLLVLAPLAIVLFRSFVPFWVALFLFFGLDLFNNTASPALLPVLVGERHILAANSASLTLARVATVSGMLIGGFLIRWVGWSLGLVIDATTHLAAGLLALSIARASTAAAGPRPGPALTERTLSGAAGRFFRELLDVLRLVGRNRLIGFVMASIVVSTFVSAVAYTVLIFLIQQTLGLGTAGVGVFSGILAFGMIAGAAGMGFVPERISRPLVILGVILLYGLLFLVGWFHISLAFMAGTALLAGVSFSWLSIVQNTVLQEQVSPEVRARIFSTREFITNATFILSTLLIGLFGDLTSYRHALLVIGVVLVGLATVGFLLVRGGTGRPASWNRTPARTTSGGPD